MVAGSAAVADRLLIGPPLIFAVNYLMRRLRRATRESVEVNSRLIGAMQEATQGIAIVKAFTMEEQLATKMAGWSTTPRSAPTSIARVSERLTPDHRDAGRLRHRRRHRLCRLSRASVSSQPPGAVFSFITALLLAYDPARRLARVQVEPGARLVNARMIYEILDIEPQQRDVPGAAELAGRRRARCASTTCPSPIATIPPCCAVSASPPGPARPPRSSARRAPASRR
jgi:ATP-binding cassette subfamily B protein